MNSSYPGGLAAYIRQSKILLEAAKNGENPLDGWSPEVPTGVTLKPFSSSFDNYEASGKYELGSCGFILVAGGLGERLGYNGIKIELPSNTTTSTSYIELYIKEILSMQSRYAKADLKLPLAIMVSDDTVEKTMALLERNNSFGMAPDQITIMKQEKVAAITSTDAKISQLSPYEIDAKPHGHGDVHSLMHSTGTAARWLAHGIKWCVFFQDTNGLSFTTLSAMLGVSVSLDLAVNSLAVPRVAKQAVGAITKLIHKDGREMTVNVEYNQLDPLLRATGSPEGDVNDPATGLSPYPGNINQLVFKMAPYVATLEQTQGVMSEFVNPKYADSTRTTFKKPTRLECMMQDYPKALPSGARVGFTMAPAWICYSPCKNNATDAAASAAAGVPASAAFTAESDQYFAQAEILRNLGVICPSDQPQTYLGITAVPGPRIVLDPSFAIFPSEVRERIPYPHRITISPTSTLTVQGDVVIRGLHLDGALKLVAAPGTRLLVRAGNAAKQIKNAGYVLHPLSEAASIPALAAAAQSEVCQMRGYVTERREELVVETVAPDHHAFGSVAVVQEFVFNGDGAGGVVPVEVYDDVADGEAEEELEDDETRACFSFCKVH